MKIIITDTTLMTPPTGGAHTFLVDLCAGLSQKGWKISIVTQAGPEQSIVRSLEKTGAEVNDQVWRDVHLPEERGALLARWINERRPDIYIISTSPDAGWLALPLLDPAIGTISIAHNDVDAYYAPLAHYGTLIDCAVGVSAETHRKIVSQCGVSPARSCQIPYGVKAIEADEVEAHRLRARDREGPLRIGYVGRLVQLQKRVMDFIPLADELERRGVAFELHLIGDGSERKRLQEELARRAPVAPVKFWGWLLPEEVKQRLLELDLFILLSDYEGLPVALLEAMGHGLAPVVTNIASGNGELVRDGDNGFIVPVGDSSAFADRVEILSENREQLRALQKAAWETSRNYSVDRMLERYRACFNRIRAKDFSLDHRTRGPRPYPVMQSCRSPYPVWLRKMKRRWLTLAQISQPSCW